MSKNKKDLKKEYRIEGKPKTIYKVVKSAENPYVMIDRRPIDNAVLSFKAKGILTYLMSRPDGWEVSVADLVNHSTDGDDSVRSGLKELRKAGHMKQTRTREAGRITGFLIEVYELPYADFQHVGKPDMEKPDMENPTQVISTSSNTERNKKDRKKEDDSFSNSKKDDLQSVCDYWQSIADAQPTKTLRAAVKDFLSYAESLQIPRGQYISALHSLIEKTHSNDAVQSPNNYMLECLRGLRASYEIYYPTG